MSLTYFIQTFGCQQNESDSTRLEKAFQNRGMKKTKSFNDANYVIINTCMVRESAENRVYGLVNNLSFIKEKKRANNEVYKIIVTGCMVGLALRDNSGVFLKKIRKAMPAVDEFMPIEEVGFDSQPLMQDKSHAWVTISNGCNNFCTFCVVPFTRGREISRPLDTIIKECKALKKQGVSYITLLGQNVNSYGADLLLGRNNIQVMRDMDKLYFPKEKKQLSLQKEIKDIKPVYVQHLGRQRIPTLFPHLLATIAEIGFEKVDFISSNPWDFSDELIDIIAKHPNISRLIHLPVQSGDTNVLRRMNRWYTRDEYLNLAKNLKLKIKDLKLTTDIIVGFCGETEEEFLNTYKLAKEIGFSRAYIAMYSSRPMTAATKVFSDDIPHPEKKRRWQMLEDFINQPNLTRMKTLSI